MSAVAVAERTLQIPTAEAFLPMLEPARYKGLYGGRGAAKSHFFAENLVERALMQRTQAVCIREYQRTLQQSAKKLIEEKIDTFNLRDVFRITTTQIEGPNDSLFIFEGMQDHNADSIKSLEGFDVAWVEEAQNLSKRSLDLLRPTIFRLPDSELWASWNPRNATDPIDVLFRGPDGPLPGMISIGVTYRDNPFFPDGLRLEMEWDRSHDSEKYAHVWGGEYERHSESRVFKNWVIEEFDAPVNTIFYFGADWGYSKDPSTLVRLFIVGPRDLYIDYEAYKVGVEIDDLPALFDTVPASRERPIRADSARPETISYLQRHGFPKMVAAKKGPNSVKEGVIFLQNYRVHIHPRCVQTIKEFTHYSFVVDKMTGAVTSLLKDDKNHIIDSTRYATEEVRQPAVADWVTW